MNKKKKEKDRNKYSINKAKKLQEKLAPKVLRKNHLPHKIKTVAAVDVSYKGDTATCAAVIMDFDSFELLQLSNVTERVSFPYVPGFFMLRESKPILHVLKKLDQDYDVLLVDGNGVLHPRQFGLACYIGVMVDKPVIGVAKSLLCGKVIDSKVYLNNRIVGYELRKSNNKKVYVSVGHKVHLRTAVRIVKHLTANDNNDDNVYPIPLQLADNLSKSLRKKIKNKKT